MAGETRRLAEYAAGVRDVFSVLDVGLAFEPGRLLVAGGGVLVSEVVYVKDGARRKISSPSAAEASVR